MNTTRDSLVLDDLEPGHWYRFTTRANLETEGQFLGYDDCYALLREEDSLRSEPWPTTFLARCRIEALYSPVEIIDPEYEPIAEARELLDVEDNQQVPPWPHRDLRILLCLLAASAVGWIALFLYAFPFWR